MLFTETATSSTFELLKCLMRDAALKDFVLVGGVDLDLFSDVSFDEGELSGYLISEYNLELDFIAKCTL